ncbi:hypothetical protein HLB42_09765 [Deinococcus sp. D7000]|uniref:hypothetical protein n=1 Tax=Deinococcus radiopugnans TaxID=57497 RepID=UPI000B28ADD3|nr:hypothetical protein [Deinococcus radiopugnans]QLG11029.1 hypothetical protein HLB42_09765 [Deinococcus sp. D7000]
MRRGTELLFFLAIALLVLAGVLASPVLSPALIVAGAGAGRVAWVRADRDELLRRFA